MITKNREYRNFDFDTNEEMKLTGIPVVFNAETVLYEINEIQYKEVISRNALDNADLTDVVLNIDHMGKPAAKTKNNTLRLEIRDEGLYMEADLAKNVTGRELYEDVRNGFYDKMSFAFSVEEEYYDKETRTRYITKIKKLYDVSCVTHAAYNQTSVSARNFFEAQKEIENKAQELNLRKKLILKTYL
jgi:HK97 family phage prohead protease